MRRIGAVEYKAALRIWTKLGIPPLPDSTMGVNKQRALLSRLSKKEKEMMMYVTEEENEFRAVRKIREMHPGKREMIIRNLVIKMYEHEDWKENVKLCEQAGKGLCRKLDLREPNTTEKLDAADTSRIAVITEDKETEKTTLEMSASIAYKLRKAGEKSRLTFDSIISELSFKEVELLMEIVPAIRGCSEVEADDILEELNREFREKVNRRGGMKSLHESLKMLMEMSGMDLTALRKALSEKKEVQTLYEFFGEKRKECKIKFMDERVFSEAWHRKNGDSGLSAEIEYEDGESARIDAVFDGVSYSGKAEEASQIAKEVFEIMLMLKPPKNADDLKTIMTMADLAVFAELGNDNNLNLPATTGVVTLLRGNKLITAHAGDSRWMVFRDGKLLERSMDHSYMERMAMSGIPCPEHMKNQLASALGNVFDFLESSEIELKKGDAVVLCSDGISGGVRESEIADAVSHGIADAPGILLRFSDVQDDKTVIAYLVETGAERISLLDGEMSLDTGRNKMTELAAGLGVQQGLLEMAMISMVKGNYDLEVPEMPTSEEMFEIEMILESRDAEKMARISLLLHELRNPAAADKEKKFKQLHDLVSTLDGEKAIRIYDRFHYLLGESGKFDRPDALIESAKPKKRKKRKFRKRGRK